MTAIPFRKLTYDDLLAIPDDGQRRELIDGGVVESPAPGWDHFALSRKLFLLMLAAAQATSAGEVVYAPLTVRLSETSVLEPDLFFIRAERLRALRKRGSLDGAPDLAVEIISPSSRQTDSVLKPNLYARHRVSEYWLIDPEKRTVTVYALTNGQYVAEAPDRAGRLASRVLPGLVVDTADLIVGLYDDAFGNDSSEER